jgi:IclR family pca regulon transcriptional regulator
MNRSVGIHLPALSTAIGRILVAHLKEEKLRTFFEKVEIRPLTPFTIVNRVAIDELLAQIREQDFAYVDQELEVGLKSIGIPIRNRGGQVVAGLSISFIGGQLAAEEVTEKYLPELRGASVAIKELLPG